MGRTTTTTIGIGAAALIVGVVWFAAMRIPSDSGTVRVGVDQSPPFYIIGEDGSVRGLAVDVLNEAARRRGIHLIWKPLHDIPIDEALSKGVVDLWPLVGTTPQRRAKFFLSSPWLQSEYLLVSRRENPVRNPAEGAGKVVAHARLTFTAIIAQQYLSRSKLLVKHLRLDAVEAVCTGEAAAVLVESYVLDTIMLTRPPGCETTSFYVASLAGATTPLSIAAVPQVRASAQALSAEITALSKDGFLSRELNEWTPFSAEGTRSIWAQEGVNERSRIYAWCLVLIVLLSAVLGRLAFRAWSLKKAAERAEAGRREIQRRFTAFMDHSPAVAFMKDAAGRLLYANPAWSEVFGRNAQDCYGKTEYELWPQETARQIRETDQALLADDKPRQLVESIPVSLTDNRELLVVKFPFSNADGERFVGGTALDITARETAIRELAASETRHRELFEHNPLPAWVYDRATGAFLTVNAAAIKAYGWTREDFLSGMRVSDIQVPGEPIAGGARTHVTKGGLPLRVDVTSYELQYERRPACLMIVRDLTEREKTLEQLRISEERWQLAFRGAGDALWDWDIVSGRVFRSPRWCAMLGYDESEIGDTREDLTRLLHPDDVEATNNAIELHLRGTVPSFSAEYRLRHKDGTWRWIMDRGQAIADERGRPVRMAGSHTDITERKAAESLLALQARTDALTGVTNRREFERLFSERFRIARLQGEALSVCICDLDHFKDVNDLYGHAAGDRVLIAFTGILRNNLRSTDTLARIGGDEFVIALPRTPAKDACLIMERMREQLRTTSFTSGEGLAFDVTSSFGVAELKASHANCGELMEDADRCLYDAKGSGRNRTLAM